MSALKIYEKWVSSPSLDESLRNELIEIKGNQAEIEERFSVSLEFGTGGLRGIIRAGTNGMNIHTVRWATQGLSNLIIKTGADAMKKGVAIAYDSRLYSKEFAAEAAAVFAANGIKAFLFPELSPTPLLSFAVRELGAIAGVVVTASHNPAKYNGYKAYWSDGGQLPPEEADIVYAEMNKVDIFCDVKTIEFSEGMKNGLIEYVSQDVNEAYYKAILELSINKDAIKNTDISVVYTPFHGAGNIPVREILKRVGLKNITVVKEQELPDPAFSTVKSPNPEDPDGFYLAIDYAKKVDADIIIGTDPDSDRVGLLLKNKASEYEILNGNQIGIILVNYILQGRKKNNAIPENGVVVKTIVTTNMIYELAKEYNISVINVLTGFKFIGEQIKMFEETGKYTYLFGFEESYGYLSGTHARDKDAINAAMLICEAAAFYKEKGKTLKEVLDEIYKKYGYYNETQLAITHEGITGAEKIKKMMAEIRENLPWEFSGVKCVEARDYLSLTITDMNSMTKAPLDFAKSNVLSFLLTDGTVLTIRPSGTEPKIKAYVMTKGKTPEEMEENMNKYTIAMKGLLN